MKNLMIKLEIKDAIKKNDIKKLDLIYSRYPNEFKKYVLEIVE
jgi:hypothetical protein